MFAQVRELLTNYGKIDVIWFDGQWERTPQQWKSEELAEMIRSLQPDILINDRLPGSGGYQTPEQSANSGEGVTPSLTVTNAAMAWPLISSCLPTTADSATEV